MQPITISWTDQTTLWSNKCSIEITKYYLFNVCFQPDQDILTYMNKNQKKEHSFLPMPASRPRLVVRLVGIADYMSAGLEGNDNHTSTCTLKIYTMNVHAL